MSPVVGRVPSGKQNTSNRESLGSSRFYLIFFNWEGLVGWGEGRMRYRNRHREKRKRKEKEEEGERQRAASLEKQQRGEREGGGEYE